MPYYYGLPLWKNKWHDYLHSGNNGLAWRPWLADSAPVVGERWDVSKEYGGAHNYRITYATDTSKVINGILYEHVIVTRDYTDVGGIYFYGTDRYYAKDVGLIAECSYKLKPTNLIKPTGVLPADSLFYISELKEYFINK